MPNGSLFMGRSDFVSRSLVLADLPIERSGRALYVSGTEGADGDSGLSWDKAKLTVQAAIDAAEAFDTIVIEPGAYAENVSVLRTKPNLTLVGLEGYGGVAIEALSGGVAATVHADDVTFLNVDLAGDGAGGALVATGSRLRARECKLEGGATLALLGPGTVAQEAAESRGRGGDFKFTDCEFAWGDDKGVILQGTDFGAATQLDFLRCLFHNIPTASFEEATGAGGAAALHYRNLWIRECAFDAAEDGTAPTKWLSLNDDNANTGLVTRSSFPTAINGGKNLVSTALKWVGNYHTGGLSAAQPS